MQENSDDKNAPLPNTSMAPPPPLLLSTLGKIVGVGSIRIGTDEVEFFQVDFEMADGKRAKLYICPTHENGPFWRDLGITPNSTTCIGMWLYGLNYKKEDKLNADSTPTIYKGPIPSVVETELAEAEIDALTAIPAEVPLHKGRNKKGEAQRLYPEMFDGCEQPKSLWRNRRYGTGITTDQAKQEHTGLLHLAGKGSKSGKVMFISPCTLLEDYRISYSNVHTMLKGPPGNLFTRTISRMGFQEQDWWYTALCKYNVPKLKPQPADIRWNEAILLDEIATIKPRIIVCLGKVVFDYLWSKSMGKARKFALKDVQGGFFECPAFNCVLYPMDTIMTPLMKPEYLDRFMVDLRQVRLALDEIEGISTVVKVDQHYVTIENTPTLINVLSRIKTLNATRLAVDCEWHGQTWVGGQLRSFQFCWQEGFAAYLKLMNQKQKYCFDVPIEVVRNLIRPVFGNPEVKFVGHNASADMPWMKYHLGIDVYQRIAFDTMYAQHTINEYADLKLERCAVRYTDLGRYDIDLCLWKKDNQFDDDNEPGYGRVPDRIIIPYGLKDVDATMRIWPHLVKKLVQAELMQYYTEFLLPFVTDGFFEMMDIGLPINIDYLEELREVFTRNQGLLLTQFRIEVQKEALTKLHKALKMLDEKTATDRFVDIFNTIKANTNAEGIIDTRCDEIVQMREEFKSFAGVEYNKWALPFIDHLLCSSQFNINSTDHLKRWLFQIKGLRPLKTTKREGMQLSWEKVEAMTDVVKRATYEPAADKQTIKIYADKDPLVAQVQELKSVGNIVKAFLKGPDEEGREQGIPKWIQSDGRIHANFALTETARPRAWKPNILNWPKSVTKPIEAAFARIQKAYPAHAEKPATLRSVVEAPPGWCIIDMDLKTAEIVALAYQANDENMIRVLTEPDLQFARIDKDNPKKVARIAYNENSCFPESEFDQSLIVAASDPRILRKADNSIAHPKRDLHWEMAEAVAGKPREKLDERLYRDGCGKVGNFSIPYGASPTLIERLIEVNTGIKPKEGMGELTIKTWETRYPEAAKFQKYMAGLIENPGFWRSLSGRVRHFFMAELSDITDIKDYDRQNILSPLERQARNFPCQELVAATTGKALLMFIEQRRKLGLRSRVGILLYDAITAFAPLEEAKQTSELLKNCLTDWVPWTVNGRTFNFEVDISYAFRWGSKLTKEEKERIAPYIK